MGCQQSRNTLPTEYFDQDEQQNYNNNNNEEENKRVNNLFSNMSNLPQRNMNDKQIQMNQQIPQAKGCRQSDIGMNNNSFNTSVLSKKFNSSRTLDMINNELFSHCHNNHSSSQQSQQQQQNQQLYSKDSRRTARSIQEKENISILNQFRQSQQQKQKISFSSNHKPFQTRSNSIRYDDSNKQKSNENKYEQDYYQNYQNSQEKQNINQSISLSSQVQVRFQSTFKNNNNNNNNQKQNQSINSFEEIKLLNQNQYNFMNQQSQKKQQVLDSARQIMSIRAGKSILSCQEEYDCIKFIIYEKILPEMERSNSPLINYQNEIKYLLNNWGEQVHSKIIEQTGEIKNYVSIRNTNDFIRITHELSCWRNYILLEQFVTNVLKQPLNHQYLNKVRNNAQGIKALSCFIWIELSYQKELNKLEVQIGISERQPYDQKLLDLLITNKNERNNIMDWYHQVQPIADEYGYIINSTHYDEIFDFYIFENDEATNLHSSLQAFYNYGGQFSQIPGNDFHVMFHLNKFGLLNLKLALSTVYNDVERGLFQELLKCNDYEQNQCEILQNVWDNLNDNVFHEDNLYILHMIELNPDGYFLYKTREVSIDDE